MGVKVPWRAVSVYFAATVSIQQITHSRNLSKVCSIPFTIKSLSTSPRSSTASFKKVNPFNANAQAHYTPSSTPLFTASTSLHDTQAGTSVFFPLPQHNLSIRRNRKLTVSKSLFHLETYAIESYCNLEASSLQSLCPRRLIRKNSRHCPSNTKPHSVNAFWPTGACHCSRPPIRYLRDRSPWK